MTDPKARLIESAIRFADWAAGEGICPMDGSESPDDFLMAYSEATGDEDWATLAERMSAALSWTREAVEPFMWLTKHDFNEMRMPASPNRTITGWRQPQDKSGRDLVPLYYAAPPSDPVGQGAVMESLREEVKRLRGEQQLYWLHVEALAEIKATVDGKSEQPVRDIIYGLLDEIAALSPAPEAVTCPNTGLPCVPHCDQRSCAGINIPLNEWPITAPEAGSDEVERLRTRVAELERALASDARVETILAAVLVSRDNEEDGTRDHLPRVLRDFLSEENGRAGLTGFNDGWAEGYGKAETEITALREKLGKMREALAFYADRENYHRRDPYLSYIDKDNRGDKARRALSDAAEGGQ